MLELGRVCEENTYGCRCEMLFVSRNEMSGLVLKEVGWGLSSGVGQDLEACDGEGEAGNTGPQPHTGPVGCRWGVSAQASSAGAVGTSLAKLPSVPPPPRL